MMKTANFFRKPSAKVNASGPSPEAQLSSMADDRYWSVLNTHLLIGVKNDKDLSDRVNAFKHALQTYGPNPETNLPDLRQNTGKAKSFVFHGHVRNTIGTTYVLEWTVVDKEKRIMALLGFDTHENYKYQQKPLTQKVLEQILNKPNNLKILTCVPQKIIDAKNKVKRMGGNDSIGVMEPLAVSLLGSK